MSEQLILPAGMVVKLDERKFALKDNYVVSGDVIPEKDKDTQKTYMLKVMCPSCFRIMRVSTKNWIPTNTRANVRCIHTDGTEHIMELEDATEEPSYAG